MNNELLQMLLSEHRLEAEIEAYVVVRDHGFSIPISGLASFYGKLILFGEELMSQKTMSRIFLNMVEEAKKYGELRDLLIKGDEANRPKMKINNRDFVLGLVDDKPMLLSSDDKHELLDPNIVAGAVDGISWNLQSIS